MNNLYEEFFKAGEYFAAGLFYDAAAPRFLRYAKAYEMFLTYRDLPEYNGGLLYPCGQRYPSGSAVFPSCSLGFNLNYALLEKKGVIGAEEVKKEYELYPWRQGPHTAAGNLATHSIPNYGRVLREGLNSYRKRIDNCKDPVLKEGLLCVLRGIEAYRNRLAEAIRGKAPDELVNALRKVPFEKAENLYEAIVAWNFIFYMDGCDNPGRMDADLYEFYRGENVEPLLSAFFDNVDATNGFSLALGPDYNGLTEQILRAVAGKRRPMIELRVTEDMPDKLWELAAKSIRTGCGQPAFYNESLYQRGLREKFPDIPETDLLRFNGGGCTETMLAGMSNVGSIDAGINMPLLFSDFSRGYAGKGTGFKAYYNGFIAYCRKEIKTVLNEINSHKKARAKTIPMPMRTLLIDDCIDKGLDFYNGGARYNWGVVNLAGIVNVIDSLLAVRELVFEKKKYSLKELFENLDAGDADTLAACAKCPCHGRDDDKADSFSDKFTAELLPVFDEIGHIYGGKFLPASIQFNTNVYTGYGVPATPDGRTAGGPLADSLAAIHGKDKLGVTAMLNSVARLNLHKFLGTPVVNLRLSKNNVVPYLAPIVKGFFQNGGMMLQVNCISREDMEDALIHPERHENLIVRVSGYSDYFNWLDSDLKREIMKRTEF